MERNSNKVPLSNLEIVFQKNAFDCGLACICMYASLYDIDISLSNLASIFPKEGGMSMAEVLSIIGKYEIPANAYHSFVASELFDKTPFIAHFKRNHYSMVLFRADGLIYLADPSCGYLQMGEKEFFAEFSGYFISE